jgi:hypothetical protein
VGAMLRPACGSDGHLGAGLAGRAKVAQEVAQAEHCVHYISGGKLRPHLLVYGVRCVALHW